MPTLDKITGPLGQEKAMHLLRRATFGPTPDTINQFSALTIDQALDTLFANVATPAVPIDPKTGTTWLNKKAGASNSSAEELIQYFLGWFLEQMRTGKTSIKERIVWFLHTHMPTRITLLEHSEFMYYQNALYRYYAFGSFRTLFRKLIVDNAMLIYLDNGTNQYQSPNENFAREMFELYTIGRGQQIGEGNYTNYTEDDIKAATRVLTGYMKPDFEDDLTFTTIDPDTGLPTGRMHSTTSGADEIATEHDPETKVFSSAFQGHTITPSAKVQGMATVVAAKAELDDLVNMIFNQEATAKFLVRKLYRHFVYYKIDETIENDIITPLAQTFKNNNYSIPAVLRQLLGSEHFYNTDNSVTTDNTLGAIIKSPLEVTLGMNMLFDVEFPTNTSDLYKTVYTDGILPHILKQGLSLFEPYDVAGYDAYYQAPNYNRNWITPNYLAYRYQFAAQLITGKKSDDSDLRIKMDVLSWVDNTDNVSDASDPVALVQRLADLMFPFPISTERLDYFIDDILLDGNGRYVWPGAWTDYKNGTSGAAQTVELQLQRLLTAMLQTPEFQLY
jgi:uncharacterized protein (DUF1800 family)